MCNAKHSPLHAADKREKRVYHSIRSTASPTLSPGQQREVFRNLKDLLPSISTILDRFSVADPEGFHRFPLKPPLLDNVYNNNIHLQQRYTATLDSKETSLPCSKFVD